MDGFSTTAPTGDAAAMHDIESRFPGWGLWRSGTGRWWAFRTAADPLTIAQLRAGCRLLVHANTLDALREAIRTEVASARCALADPALPDGLDAGGP